MYTLTLPDRSTIECATLQEMIDGLNEVKKMENTNASVKHIYQEVDYCGNSSTWEVRVDNTRLHLHEFKYSVRGTDWVKEITNIDFHDDGNGLLIVDGKDEFRLGYLQLGCIELYFQLAHDNPKERYQKSSFVRIDK